MKELTTNRVYELRMKSEITQEELARAVGVTRQTIIAIEKGNYTPSVLLALKIAKFFKKPLEEVFIINHGPSIKTQGHGKPFGPELRVEG